MTDMTETVANPGEIRDHQRRRRKLAFYSACGVLGMVLGMAQALVETGDGNFVTGDIAALSVDPLAAVILAIGFAVGLLVLPLWGFTQVDEHLRQLNLIALAAGAMAVIAGYPVWAVLAIGGLLPLPGAFGLFVLAFATTGIAYAVVKLRS